MTRKYCFVAMPFRPELNFFFLYVKDHLERQFSLLVERGDADVLTKPLMDKIRGQIMRADLVIGDITGNNPNVFYELGLAHAAGKPVVFLTQDPPEQAPVDVRQFEYSTTTSPGTRSCSRSWTTPYATCWGRDTRISTRRRSGGCARSTATPV